VGAFEAWTGWAGGDICIRRGVSIDLRRRIPDTIAPFSRLFGVLIMAFRALGARAAYRQMRVHLAVRCGCIGASSIMAASHDLVAHAAVRGVGLCIGRC
jgi:hypothetical protein